MTQNTMSKHSAMELQLAPDERENLLPTLHMFKKQVRNQTVYMFGANLGSDRFLNTDFILLNIFNFNMLILHH